MSEPETTGQDRSSLELRPSSLFKVERSTASNTMIRRRYTSLHRAQDRSSNSLPLSSTFCPIKASLQGQSSSNKDASADGDTCGDTQQLRDTIFSITTTSFLILMALLTIVVCCFCMADKAALHVSAYSNNPPTYSQQQQQQQQVHNTKIEGTNGAQIPTMQQQMKVQQETIRPTSSSKNLLLDERRIRQSIDRFDSGEQIRPPLLRQPTTVAPLSRVQASVDKAFNLQEAASQDTYMSPEDRDRIMRQQESHYEGRNPDQQQATYDRYEQGERPLGAQHHPINSNQNLRPEASAHNAKAGDDDSDYDDDSASDTDKRAANLVPENRRRMVVGGSGSLNQANGMNSPQAAAANLDEESNDDYGGANDDAYFSRKTQNQANPNQLSQAASYNQHNRGPYDGQDPTNHHRGNEGAQQESQGFGPGPNEAYMADRAESGEGAGVDQGDDEPGQLGTGLGDGSESTNMGDYEGKVAERRALNGQARGEPAPFDPTIRENANDASDADNDNDDGGDGSDESGSAYAPSTLAGIKTSRGPVAPGINSRKPTMNSVMPRTSASAPAPLSAPRPPAMATNGPLTPTTRPMNMVAHQQPMQAPQLSQVHQQQQYRHPIQVERGLNPSQLGVGPQKSLNTPYNPQNNPSHAGKYFIN